MASDDEKERVRDAVDFVALVSETVVLRQRGADDFWGCCPFHQEKSPSFHVRPSTGLWHCFGCDEGGDVFSYLQKRDNLSFREALEALAERAGIELEHRFRRGPSGPARARMEACLAAARDFYHLQLMRGMGQDCAEGRAYLSARGFGAPVCRAWGLGYAPGRGSLVAHLTGLGFTREELLACDLALPGNRGLRDRFFERVIFPITNERGAVIGLGGRVLGDGKPKYLNSKDSTVWHKSKNLFAYDRARQAIQAAGEAVVVEGYTDAISLHAAGIENVVAVLGTALTEDHMRLLGRLKPSRVVMMLDGDGAGQRAAEKAVRFVGTSDAQLSIVTLPGGQDPAEFLAADGVEALRARIAAADPLIDVVLERRLSALEGASPGAKAAGLAEIARILAPLKGSVLLDGYVSRVADYLNFDRAQVARQVQAARPLPEEGGGREPRRGAAAPAAADDAPPYDDVPPDYDAFDAAAQDDYFGGAAPLSPEERRLRDLEAELLGTLAAAPALLPGLRERVAALAWSDPRHRQVAWALLEAPGDATPRQLVAAAAAREPEAPRILSSSAAGRAGGEPTAGQVELLLLSIELDEAQAQLRQVKASLGFRPSDLDLLREATRLQERIRTLQASIAQPV